MKTSRIRHVVVLTRRGGRALRMKSEKKKQGQIEEVYTVNENSSEDGLGWALTTVDLEPR